MILPDRLVTGGYAARKLQAHVNCNTFSQKVYLWGKFSVLSWEAMDSYIEELGLAALPDTNQASDLSLHDRQLSRVFAFPLMRNLCNLYFG